MYCLRWWIPLFLLPFPKTSPLFLILFLVSFAMHSQPCMYCALILTGLFSTSSDWYGPSSTIVPLSGINSTASTAASNSSQPRPSYGWLDFGLSGGNGFFSPLHRPCSGPAGNIATELSSSLYRLSLPWSKRHVTIPKRFYFGLGKHQGLGMWIDLGSDMGNSSPNSQATQKLAAESVSLPPQMAAHKHIEL
ncbi:hypothetical protein NDA13_004552 [Ustilago tritici]|nr:hypothetical protein NDA13_004552 [Ustilago tritici]